VTPDLISLHLSSWLINVFWVFDYLNGFSDDEGEYLWMFCCMKLSTMFGPSGILSHCCSLEYKYNVPNVFRNPHRDVMASPSDVHFPTGAGNLGYTCSLCWQVFILHQTLLTGFMTVDPIPVEYSEYSKCMLHGPMFLVPSFYLCSLQLS